MRLMYDLDENVSDRHHPKLNKTLTLPVVEIANSNVLETNCISCECHFFPEVAISI